MVTLDTLLTAHCAHENMQGGAQLRCGGCGNALVDGTKTLSITGVLPPWLLVSLKRFTFGEANKIATAVDVGNLSVHQGELYIAVAVVDHWGNRISSGHYVARTKEFVYSDTNVSASPRGSLGMGSPAETYIILLVAARHFGGLSDAPRGHGLKNLGNSCYMNATLQLIMQCPPLVASVRALGSALKVAMPAGAQDKQQYGDEMVEKKRAELVTRLRRTRKQLVEFVESSKMDTFAAVALWKGNGDIDSAATWFSNHIEDWHLALPPGGVDAITRTRTNNSKWLSGLRRRSPDFKALLPASMAALVLQHHGGLGVVMALHTVLVALDTRGAVSDTVVDPSVLRDAVRSHALCKAAVWGSASTSPEESVFVRTGREEDAHEFMRLLLSCIEDVEGLPAVSYLFRGRSGATAPSSLFRFTHTSTLERSCNHMSVPQHDAEVMLELAL